MDPNDELIGGMAHQCSHSLPAHEADTRLVRVTVPVLGDGLSNATVLTLLCAPGCAVQRDQVIAELEIDKAILQVESPVDGMLASWFVKPGQHVDFHEPLAMISLNSLGFEDMKPRPPLRQGSRLVQPISQPLCTPGGLNWSSLAAIRRVVPAAAQRIIPYCPTPTAGEPKSRRMTLTASVAWGLAQAMGSAPLRQELPRVLQAAVSDLSAAVNLQESLERDRADLHQALALASEASPDLGVAVSAEDGVLRTAVIRDVLNLDATAFQAVYRLAVKETLAGQRQSLSKVAWIVSSLGPQGPTAAVPVVVPPAFGTLFLHAAKGELSLWLSFDHRWITGERADRVLRQVEQAFVALATNQASS